MDNQNNSSNGYFDENQLKVLCYHCFEVLISTLTNRNEKVPFPNNFRNYAFPLFVTWTTGSEKELRGCIGTFVPNGLEQDLPQYALIAALNDSRFIPISLNEVPNLQVGVSLLVNFEPASHPLDWEIGKHGIEIDFIYRNREYGGTFLPEVAKEQEWDQHTTLNFLVRKAGLNGDWEIIKDTLKVVRYQSIKIFMSFQEYMELKESQMNL